MTRKTMWRTAVAGGAAVVFTGLTAVPAGAAEGGVSFTRVKVNSGKPIVIGVKEEVEVPASGRMTTKLTFKGVPVVHPYRGKLGKGEELWSALGGGDPEVVDPVKGVYDFAVAFSIHPRHAGLKNKDAGTWKTCARISLAGGGHDVDDEHLPLQVKRATRLTVNASPEPVTKGKTLTVTGTVTRADWDKHTYQGYAGRTVSLQFRPAGASSYKTVKKARSNSKGALKTTVKATGTGTWRWTYHGNSTSGARSSSGDHVAVK
ncbi:hypothetical protein SJI45_22815 [Streptomyces sp. S399]|uniref:hypothetical protein n=1 Tax=Streptomyces sp. S399 TaxID=3096009 RepID=UPI002A7F7CA3|nr:hypothetical protein [Streptomyces sp. S399]WPR53461.1 hypothetical protein SJI45_22815 [Streptomyces sp. S399]